MHETSSATFFKAQEQGNNKVIWLLVFVACSCFVRTCDVRESSINSASLSTNGSIHGYEESVPIYFSMENKYASVQKPRGLNSNKAERSSTSS